MLVKRLTRKARWFIVIALIHSLCLLSCQKGSKSEQEKQQDCLKAITEYEKQNPFSQREAEFFLDQTPRNILKISQLKYISTTTETVSKKRSADIMKFQFFHKNQRLSLQSSKATGGMKIDASNHITYDVYCKVVWDLFARSPVEQKIWVEEVDLDHIRQDLQKLIEEHGQQEDITFEKMQKEMEEPDL
jgi:hypothetical protein